MKSNIVRTYLPTAISAAMLTTASATSAQNIFVANWYPPGTIYSITPGGTVSTFVSSLGNQPEELAFDGSGNLFVAGSTAGTVDKVTGGGAVSTFASGLGNVNGLAFNSVGDLFTTDFAGGNIYELTPGGTKTTFASGLNGPKSLAFNTSGDLFVSDSGTGNIYEFTPGGTKTTFVSGIASPNGLVFNASGNLFVGYSGTTNGVIEFAPNGIQGPFVANFANAANDLAFNSAGNLFVTDGGSLLEITPGGSVSTFASGLGNATGIAIQPVPEPSTIALAVLGGTALLLRRRKH
jgi:sugar lactone lactonase YvrE